MLACCLELQASLLLLLLLLFLLLGLLRVFVFLFSVLFLFLFLFIFVFLFVFLFSFVFSFVFLLLVFLLFVFNPYSRSPRSEVRFLRYAPSQAVSPPRPSIRASASLSVAPVLAIERDPRWPTSLQDTRTRTVSEG